MFVKQNLKNLQMKLHSVSILLVISTLLIMSCLKNEETEEDIFYCVAGYYDEGYEFHNFTSPIILNAKPDSTAYVMNDSIAISLLLNNTTENISVKISYVNPDSINIINEKDSFIIQNLKIISSDKIQFVIEEKSYYAGLGTCASFNFVRAYKNNDLIYSNENCSNANYPYWLKMWEKPTNNHSIILNYDGGSWYNLSGKHYIAFKYQGRLGWIEVDVSNRMHPKFIRYALMK